MRGRKRTARFYFPIFVMACMQFGMLTGCSKSPPQSATPATGEVKPAGGKTRIVYIPKNTGNPYFDSVIEGFKKGTGELGIEFITVAPASADATSQIPFIKEQVQQGVQAIAISPNSPDAVLPALKEAMSKGIKVITVDADLTGHEETRDAGVLPMDFKLTGKSQIEIMSSLIGGKGEFAILSATTDAPNQNVWIQDMKETLKDPKYRDMKLVGIVYGNDDPDKSLKEAQALLTRYPALKGILAPTTVGIAAAAQAVETAHSVGKVIVTGLGRPNQMRHFIQSGVSPKVALWDPSNMGYVASYLLDGLIKGSIKSGPGVRFKAGSLGEREFVEKNVVVAGEPIVFDRSNVEQYHF